MENIAFICIDVCTDALHIDRIQVLRPLIQILNFESCFSYFESRIPNLERGFWAFVRNCLKPTTMSPNT